MRKYFAVVVIFVCLTAHAGAAVNSFPYDQGFEGATFPPADWSQYEYGQWARDTAIKRTGAASASTAMCVSYGDLDLRRLAVNVDFSGNVCSSISLWYRIDAAATAGTRYLRLVGSASSTDGVDGSWVALTPWTDFSEATTWTQLSASQNLGVFDNAPNCYAKIQGYRTDEFCRRVYVDDFQITVDAFVPTPTPTGPTPTPTSTPTSAPTHTPAIRWAQYRCDPRRSGYVDCRGATAGALKWSYLTGGNMVSSPAWWPDGNLCAGSYDGRLYVLTSSGVLEWSYRTGDRIFSSPAASDDVVYVGSTDNRMYTLGSTGSLVWSYGTAGDVYSSPLREVSP